MNLRNLGKAVAPAMLALSQEACIQQCGLDSANMLTVKYCQELDKVVDQKKREAINNAMKGFGGAVDKTKNKGKIPESEGPKFQESHFTPEQIRDIIGRMVNQKLDPLKAKVDFASLATVTLVPNDEVQGFSKSFTIDYPKDCGTWLNAMSGNNLNCENVEEDDKTGLKFSSSDGKEFSVLEKTDSMQYLGNLKLGRSLYSPNTTPWFWDAAGKQLSELLVLDNSEDNVTTAFSANEMVAVSSKGFAQLYDSLSDFESGENAKTIDSIDKIAEFIPGITSNALACFVLNNDQASYTNNCAIPIDEQNCLATNYISNDEKLKSFYSVIPGNDINTFNTLVFNSLKADDVDLTQVSNRADTQRMPDEIWRSGHMDLIDNAVIALDWIKAQGIEPEIGIFTVKNTPHIEIHYQTPAGNKGYFYSGGSVLFSSVEGDNEKKYCEGKTDCEMVFLGKESDMPM